jgi:Glycosyl transferase family 11
MKMETGITVRLLGGLGNQLFQYAAALAVRNANSTKPDIWFIMFDKNVHNTLGHNYISDLFTEGKMHTIMPSPRYNYRQEGAFTQWDPVSFAQNGPSIFLDGYFQYLPAIIPILPLLRVSFLGALRKKTELPLRPMLNTGFVHVRRGDYLLNPTYHWVQSAEYYEKGMKLLGLQKWIIFSDDIDWCSQQPCFQGCTLVDEPDELKALDLMISCCGGAVISNSSFSWWAAIFSANEGRVVYPELWSERYKPTLFPREWTMLSSSSS